ncbi:MAG TPA: Gfo/Idh/MocA family oxidoreductase [Candidatus Saccharimonadales bacterium]|nr:Gfo/Idh/MocA family oxidoreductase [Candidatus Saccharimonadales bacterium]
MNTLLTRRQFLSRSSAAFAGLWLTNRSFGKISPNEKLNLGIIGTANRAAADLQYVSTENIVALCDVDADYLAAAQQKFPGAKTYRDFRKMLERKDLDAVVVGTPDHTHAVSVVAALKSGRHVYCEKPLGHTVSEARRMSEVAKKQKRVTQMGTQIHATNNYHRVVKEIQSGVIGPVREVHVWVDVVYTGDGLPAEHPPIPAGLDWDLWLGPAQRRDYSPEYVPRKWRCWWAFGGGTLSDFGCHYIDLPQWALGLRYPTSVETDGPPVNAESTPAWLIARYEYPARGESPPLKLTWYHGEKDGQKVRPPHFAEGKLPPWGNGVLFIGDKGMLLAEYFKYVLLPEKDFPAALEGSKPDHDYERKHHQEWIEAIKTGGTTSCNFDYSGALAESVLLGNAAYRSGQKVVWDPATLRAPGNPAAEKYIQHHYRSGWKI